MDELTRLLWEYACQCRLSSCYNADSQQQRADCERMAKQNFAKLEKNCSHEVLQWLDALCGEWKIIHAEDMEAAFTCGLRLGLSLR